MVGELIEAQKGDQDQKAGQNQGGEGSLSFIMGNRAHEEIMSSLEERIKG